MESIICTTCRVQISNQDESRSHYKSQFHTYNLKRKYVSLKPVSLEIYEEKLKESALLAPAEEKSLLCECCQKEFHTQKALNKHLKGKQAATEQKIVEHSITCLFCNLESENIEINIKHMLQVHGFFIPNLEEIKDIDSMLKYLHKKVRELLLCLYCNNRQGHNFKSVQSVQQHMLNKQHCFLNTDEDEEEFKEFYLQENNEILNSEEEEIKSGNYSDVASQGSINSSHMIPAEFLPTGELRLNNGKILGSKEYQKYYKQFHRPLPQRKKQLLEIVAESHETIGNNYQWKSHREIPSDDIREKTLKQGLKNNMLQHHFRKQN